LKNRERELRGRAQRELAKPSRDNLDCHKKKMMRRKMKISMRRSFRAKTMKKMMMTKMKISRKILKMHERKRKSCVRIRLECSGSITKSRIL